MFWQTKQFLKKISECHASVQDFEGSVNLINFVMFFYNQTRTNKFELKATFIKV